MIVGRPGNEHNTNPLKEPIDTYIIIGIISAVLLGILIWQLVSLGFYNELSFYYGFLIIIGYHSLLNGLFSVTRKLMDKRMIKIFRWFIGIIMILGILFVIEFSQLLNVPPILFFLSYLLLLFVAGIVFRALGLIKTKRLQGR